MSDTGRDLKVILVTADNIRFETTMPKFTPVIYRHMCSPQWPMQSQEIPDEIDFLNSRREYKFSSCNADGVFIYKEVRYVKEQLKIHCVNCGKLFLRKETNMCVECWNELAKEINLINEKYGEYEE